MKEFICRISPATLQMLMVVFATTSMVLAFIGFYRWAQSPMGILIATPAFGFATVFFLGAQQIYRFNYHTQQIKTWLTL